ncbi:hypothetical protein [Alloalcanivorax marinus]|uniref:hypothetical protein n=1 Tax=Alloalcanivorax marinus TaxID=1177169 RepID=UPI001932462B|nr:hypothetical protein [Alloalcanivorax marinus]MBL7251486.1 hypothetical protein [Alloalcanivorax marinus]
MSTFGDWEFLLDGNAHELRQRASEKGTFYFNIYGGVDDWLDCPNDDFRMTTLYCEGEDDPKVIWKIGHELVSLFNGASVLFKKDYRKVSIHKLAHKGVSVAYEPPSSISALLGVPPGVTRQQIVDEFNNGKVSSVKFPLIHLATENKDIYFILKYLDMPPGWVTYYKLMEAVETFAKGKSVDLETVTNQRKAFTNTSNNFSLSGLDSRHGFKELTKKNNTAAMSLDEGHEFVTKMAKTYIKKAHLSAPYA